MYLVIVTHHVKPGMLEAAGPSMDSNGERMVNAPGFVARYRVAPTAENPQVVKTITIWENEEAAEKDLQDARAAAAARTGESPYASIEREAFEVDKVHLPASKR